ncbi:MAG TPA: hypothetical protein VFL78_05665 [Rhodanobacteraceae bacterium]|nr:hypothetical protein [Rhodanobacteraceae bacterium]
MSNIPTRALFATFVSAMVASMPALCHASQSCVTKRYYAYAAQSGVSAILVDSKYKTYKLVSKGMKISDMVKSSSDIGAQYINCDTDHYYCVGGRFNILVPKKLSGLTWGDDKNECSSAPNAGGQKYRVICMTDDGIVTKFMYSKSLGLLSFQTVIPMGPKYVLTAGRCGLFSEKSRK